MAIKQIATFLGPNKGLVTLGDHCYAYSGIVSVANNELDLLSFHSGKLYVRGEAQFNYAAISNQDYKYKIYFNNQIVQQFNHVQNNPDVITPNVVIPIIIPPLTEVRMTAVNTTDTNALDQIVSFVGRVYG